MKKMFLIPAFIFLNAICFLNSGCNGRNAIRDTAYNLDNCLKNCDEREKVCRKNLIDCLEKCTAKIETCARINPPGSAEYFKCLGEAIKECGGERNNCIEEFNRCMAEIDQCRQECRNKFPLAIKEN
jgi:hypothetical protein